MSAVVRRIESIVPRKAHAFGGKAKNLAALARAGFPVPAAYALDAHAADLFFESALPEQDRPAALLRAHASALGADRIAKIEERARNAKIPDSVVAALHEAFDALMSEGAVALAVRSSSTREDQEASSAAGLHETVLGVHDEEGLLGAVRECWLSLLAPRALSYVRALAAGSQPDFGVGIVIQAMVPAQVAGAMFTVNPLSGDPGEMVINASYGLGSTVMDGRVSPDTYRIDKASGWVRDRVIGDKSVAAHWERGRGLVEESVETGKREVECLSPELLESLIDLGRRVEDHFDDARDVEWAAVNGTLFLLQARPVTALSHPRRKSARKKRSRKDRSRIVWSNVNVGEALPGVATPLTWSILSEFSDRGFRRAFGALGCSVPKESELVASFRGRIYLNLSEFVEIASQVPGLRPRTLLELGGGGEVERLETQLEKPNRAGFMLRLPVTVARYLRENVGLMDRVARFEESFAEERGRLALLDLRVLSHTGLDRVLFRIEKLLDESGQVMLNVYGNLLATVVLLRAALSFVAKDDADRVERELLTGLADVESAAPGLSLWHIAEVARGEAAARAMIGSRDPHAMQIADLPEGPTRRALERFVLAHGYRCAREAEIAEPRWSEDPSLLFSALRAHLVRPNGSATPIDIERKQRELRDAAARELERRMPIPARLAVRHLLSLVQRFMRLRERLRSYVVQVLGLYRAVALDASRRLAVIEPGTGRDAAFFLSLDELHAFLRGEVRTLGPLIRRRRLQLERDRVLPDPPDTFVGFPPPVPEPTLSPDGLRGLAACGGIARGRARVLRDVSEAHELAPGEILVAPYADIGWSPLFLVAAGVVTDLGGPLSHAAVVAREYGVPTVVNVKTGTRTIRTGDEIEVDGGAGTVRVVLRAEDRAAPEEHAR
jgi:rifampicin phosphotransferase